MTRDWDLRANELSAEAIRAGAPTEWFDQLYAAGESGEVSMPWNRNEPHVLLREWVETHDIEGVGRTAVVVGCGLGTDAEYLADLGFATTGFDIAETAIRLARMRHPDSAVNYRVADLLDLPVPWRRAFDLVVEIFTIQALPDPPRTQAIRGVASLVAPAGTLLAIAFRHTGGDDATGPPFALTREAMESLAQDGLSMISAEELDIPRWRAEYRR